MSAKRIAEKNKKIIQAFDKGKARAKIDKNGVRSVELAEKVRRSFLGTRIFYNCPRCGKVLEFKCKKNRRECMHCGQFLSWEDYDDMAAVYLAVSDPDEAYYWAGRYRYHNESTYDLDIDAWRLIDKDYPLVLFFPFPAGKAYGRFMREASKEGTIIGYF